MKKYFLEIAVFVCGAVVMAYEIIGSRMLGPWVGTSAFVWSAIIGVILSSLSAGYYIGGRVADRSPKYSWLALIIFIAAVFMIISGLVKDQVLKFLLNIISNIKVISILASLILFTTPAILLGMVSPYAVRLKVKNVKTSGATAGYLYALSTLGSILGTFLAGFYLIPSFRITTIIVVLAGVLIIIAFTLFLIYNKNSSFLKTSTL